MSGSSIPSVIVDRAIMSVGNAEIRSMTSCEAVSNASTCWCWMMAVSLRYILKESPSHRKLEPLLDIIQQLSCLVEQYASPNPQGMSGVPLEFVRISVGLYLFDGLLEELGNLVTSEVNYLTLLCLIYRDGHVIRLIQPFGP
jgi:hypothetical protein